MPKKVKERKGKREKKKHPKHPKSQLYSVEGDAIKRKNRFCPKCGPGVFMAQHKNRVTCGKCGYTELAGRKPVVAENAETPAEGAEAEKGSQ